ncbi:hypothetical protein Acr_08g0000870 [Actinidia rufa]|uniref:Uncharacterized protein n=1 Tax=Actinidia rufa TaxID=165716 RepID=A0A7J0EZ28_9ERIC|nr:hypothetical protein Acr_08g0000870 [Actinidia rufa]
MRVSEASFLLIFGYMQYSVPLPWGWPELGLLPQLLDIDFLEISLKVDKAHLAEMKELMAPGQRVTQLLPLSRNLTGESPEAGGEAAAAHSWMRELSPLPSEELEQRSHLETTELASDMVLHMEQAEYPVKDFSRFNPDDVASLVAGNEGSTPDAEEGR